jgi:hypothetical protein
MGKPSQEQNFLFITESTSRKNIHSHVTSQQHRCRRAPRKKALAVHASTTLILQSIQNQKRATDLLLKVPRPLLPPTTLREPEKLLFAVSQAFISSPSPFSCADLVGQSFNFQNELSSGCFNISEKNIDVGIPLLEKGFQLLESAIRHSTSYAIIQMLHTLYICFDTKQMEVYRLVSQHFYKLSLIIFGLAHPITRLTYLFCSNNILMLDKSSKNLFRRAFELLYNDLVTANNKPNDVLAVELLHRVIITSGTKLNTGIVNYIWDKRLLGHVKILSNPFFYLKAKMLYAFCQRGEGDYQASLSTYEEIYALLPQLQDLPMNARSIVVRASYFLASDTISFGKTECKTRDVSLESYLVRAREVYEKTIPAALQFLGPQHADTIQAMSSFAYFNEDYGAALEAKAAREFVISQLEEFKLSLDEKGIESTDEIGGI